MSLQRATLLAAVATALQALVYFISYVIPLFSVPGALPLTINLVIPAAMLQLALWPAFFFSLYREHSNVPSQMPSRRIALLLAAILTVNYAAGRITSNVIYLTWDAELRSLVIGAGTVIAWLAFLVTFALGPEQPRVRRIAETVAVIVALVGLYEGRGIFSAWLAAITGNYPLQWLYHPVATAWQSVIRPGMTIIVWASEALFLWCFWKTPQPTERTPQS